MGEDSPPRPTKASPVSQSLLFSWLCKALRKVPKKQHTAKKQELSITILIGEVSMDYVTEHQEGNPALLTKRFCFWDHPEVRMNRQPVADF